jgi:coenzyme F420-reducing hydrogenase gamma subunit
MSAGLSPSRRGIGGVSAPEIYESTTSPLAKEALERIAELFEIETRINGCAPQERLVVRQQEAVPLLARQTNPHDFGRFRTVSTRARG